MGTIGPSRIQAGMMPSQTTQPYRAGNGLPDGGNNLYRGSSIIPESAFVDADTVTVTPENIGRLGGDVLLTPQQTKELYEKGSLQVRREFQTAESNEGFMTLTAKLAAALVGPSRSIAAIQIDPLFLEMIKDPNAKVGMGYTTVNKETWTVMPTPEAQPVPPPRENPPAPVFVPPPPIETPTETTKKQRELQDETPAPTGDIVVYGDTITNYWAGTASGQANFSNNQLGSTQDGTEMEVRGFGYKTGQKADPSVQRLLFTGNYNKFTGDMARHNRLDTASNIQGIVALSHTWSGERIDTQHSTRAGDADRFQFSGNDSYHFLVDQGKGIPLSGPMRDDYLAIAGPDAKNPGTVFDLYVANNKNITLGSPPSDAEEATVMGTYTQNQTEMQNLYKDLYASAFPDSPAEDMDKVAANASMEDFYTLLIATQHGQTGEDLNTLVERDSDGNVSVRDTPESREKLGNLLNIPQNKRTNASEMVASFSMLMESNLAADAGTTLLSTQSDDDKIMALHHDDLLANGHSEEDIANMGRTLDDASEVTDIESKEVQMESAHRNADNITKGSSNRGTWALNNQTLLSGTQAGAPPEDLSGVDTKIQGLPAGDEKSALVNARQGIEQLSGLVFKPGSQTEPKPHDVNYPRGEINRLITSTRQQINSLPEGPERTALESELGRIKNVDNALRGQFVMVVRGDQNDVDTTQPINSEPRIEEYYSLDEVLSDTEADTSKIQGMIDRASADSNFVVHPATIDAFKGELQNKLTIVDEILSSDNPGITDPALTPDKREQLENLKTTLTSQLEQLNDKNSPISKSAENGSELVRAHELGLTDGSVQETGSEAAFAELNTKVGEIKTYLENAMSTNGLDSEEKEKVSTLINSAYESTIANLREKGLDVSNAADVSKLTEADLQNNGNFSPQAIREVLSLSEALKDTQASAGLVSEGVTAQTVSNGISNLGNRVDNFDTEVARQAFTGELKTVAQLEDREAFDNFVSDAYNLEPRSEANAAQYETLRQSAIEGSLPLPPEARAAQPSEAANGVHGDAAREALTALQNTQGSNSGAQVSASGDRTIPSETETEERQPSIDRYAAVDMEVTPRNPHPTRDVDMRGVEAELFNAAPGLQMDEDAANRLNEHPETEDDKKFSMGDVIKGLPDLALGTAKTLEAYAERLQELVQKHFFGQNGVANNLGNASDLMGQAQSLNGYHNTNPDLKLTKLSANYSTRPVYDNQNAKSINDNSEQYHKQQLDQIVDRNTEREARMAGHGRVVG